MNAIYILAGLSIIGSFLPLTRSDYWLLRGQDYFKQVYLFLNFILLVILCIQKHSDIVYYTLFPGLIFSIIYCFSNIRPFTIFAKKEIDSSTGDSRTLRVLIYNVYQHNTKYDLVIRGLKDCKPDIIMLSETNGEWRRKLEVLEKEYAHVCSGIREDTYGMIIFSKMQIEECSVHHLVREDVPSIEMTISIDENPVRMWMLHPKPPVPGELLHSGPKDEEIYKAADKIRNIDASLSIIVAGDLNDVAWSKATNYFLRTTRLGDPRKGRGMYPTFPSWSPVKIPIDQIFFSRDIKLVKMQCLKSMGSDHHPLLVDLALPH